MFDWVNTYISLLTFVVQALTLAVLFWTLRWVRRYTLAAEKQVEASLEQVEALQRPFVTVDWEGLRGQISQTIAMLRAESHPAFWGVVPNEGFKITNLGRGAALNVSYELKNAAGERIKSEISRFLPYLPEDGFKTGIGHNTLFDLPISEFVVRYESLRGKPYVTRISIRREDLGDQRYFSITSIQTQ